MFTRKQMVELAKKYNGAKQGSARHKDLVDTFNKVKPNKEVANYKCAWCAITVTALGIKAGFTQKNYAMSYNCGTLITLAKKLGIWVESDSYQPQIGDIIIYYWKDSGKGDCKSGASHTGIVIESNGKTFKVLEGNKGTTKTCGIRTMSVNGKYIRGFITPKYAEEKKEEVVIVKPTGRYEGAYPKPTLNVGSKGEQVKNLQKFLNWYLADAITKKEVASLAVDGGYGAKTKSALMLFEKTEGISADGKYGTETAKKVKAYIKVDSQAEKLATMAESLSWAYGTDKKKWAYSTGMPTAACKSAMVSRGYKTKVHFSNCAYFQNTIIYKLLGTKVETMKGTKVAFPDVEGFDIVHQGAVTESELKRGDIVRYKKKDGTQHVLMYLGNGLISEAGQKVRFGVVKKSQKYTNESIKKDTLQVLRIKEN